MRRENAVISIINDREINVIISPLVKSGIVIDLRQKKGSLFQATWEESLGFVGLNLFFLSLFFSLHESTCQPPHTLQLTKKV